MRDLEQGADAFGNTDDSEAAIGSLQCANTLITLPRPAESMYGTAPMSTIM